MAIVTFEGSDSQQATCTASREGGMLIESCGTAVGRTAIIAPPPKQRTAPTDIATAPRSSVQLAWKDNSDNETGFIIERCDQVFKDTRDAKAAVTCRGAWRTVGTVGANTTTYVDNTVIANQTYIYRVKATNPAGSSAYTAEAVITAPVK